MARAKNTDRAEARRRYRAATAAEVESDAMSVPAAAVPRDARASGAPKAAAEPVRRPGVVESFRLAARPADIRGDIRAFPDVARHSKAVWAPCALVLVGGVILFFGVRLDAQGRMESSGSIAFIAAQMLIWPPALIPAFLAGMLAPRAAWLCGLVVGLLGAVVFSAWVVLAAPMTTEVKTAFLVQSVPVSVLFGAATGAFAGFYRRFLRIASPASQQRKAAPKNQRPAAKAGK